MGPPVTQIQENEKGEPAPVDVYTLEVDPEEAERLALAAAEGRVQLALRSTLDTETVLTTGVTIPKMLASFSYGQEKQETVAPTESGPPQKALDSPQLDYRGHHQRD